MCNKYNDNSLDPRPSNPLNSLLYRWTTTTTICLCTVYTPHRHAVQMYQYCICSNISTTNSYLVVVFSFRMTNWPNWEVDCLILPTNKNRIKFKHSNMCGANEPVHKFNIIQQWSACISDQKGYKNLTNISQHVFQVSRFSVLWMM